MTEHQSSNQAIFVKMVLDAWRAKSDHLSRLVSELSDEQLLQEVAPGRNTGAYLFGHLTVLADHIIPLLGYGEHLAQPLVKPFVQTPDQKNTDLATVKAIRQTWSNVKALLDKKIPETTPKKGFGRHTSISEEDFAREPHRNKLNVILGRIGHMDYHIGQLTFLKPNK